MARELQFGNRILVVAQPSRGVDIGATRFIHEQIVKMRNAGCAVVLISTDLDEVLLLSDEIKVLYEGQIVATLPAVCGDAGGIGAVYDRCKANGRRERP